MTGALVLVESPYQGSSAAARELNARYWTAAMRDSLERGEVPLASHVLYAASGVLDDDDPEQRARGLELGRELAHRVHEVTFYLDLGLSPGMRAMREHVRTHRIRWSDRKVASWA